MSCGDRIRAHRAGSRPWATVRDGSAGERRGRATDWGGRSDREELDELLAAGTPTLPPDVRAAIDDVVAPAQTVNPANAV